MVRAGEGEVPVRTRRREERVIAVDGVPRSDSIVEAPTGRARRSLEVQVSPGVEVYSLTFG